MDKQPETLRLAAVLDAPEEHYPGNFDMPQRANAMLLCLAQEAAAELRRLNEVETKYYELLYAVAVKWEGESRHQTALRYIRNAESTTGNAIAKATGEQQ